MSRAAPPSRRTGRQRRFAILAVLAFAGGPALSATHLCVPDGAHGAGSNAEVAAAAAQDCHIVLPASPIDETLCEIHCAASAAAKQHADHQAPPPPPAIVAAPLVIADALAAIPPPSPEQAVRSVRWRLQQYCVLLI